MRGLDHETIAQAIERLCLEANTKLRPDVLRALEQALLAEESESGRKVIDQIIQNAAIAAADRVPICQDCGAVTVYARVGRELHLEAGLETAVNDGVARAYGRSVLRASVVAEPLFERRNTGDNTPASVHCEFAEGDRLELTVMPKGAGSDNKSRLVMLRPTDGPDVISEFVTQVVEMAGADACPPVVVGVGVGGTFDSAPVLARRALLRNVGEPNPDPRAAELEQRWLERVNGLGIGPAGLGGRITALAVHLEMAATHMGSLPAAVDLSCHALRSAAAVI